MFKKTPIQFRINIFYKLTKIREKKVKNLLNVSIKKSFFFHLNQLVFYDMEKNQLYFLFKNSANKRQTLIIEKF